MCGTLRDDPQPLTTLSAGHQALTEGTWTHLQLESELFLGEQVCTSTMWGPPKALSQTSLTVTLPSSPPCRGRN